MSELPTVAPSSDSSAAPEAWLVASGTELVLGQTVDTNSAWLARELAAIGVRCARFIVVGDSEPALVDVLRAAAERADLLILTGGLGPTADDLTRGAMARAAGSPLVSDPESLAQVRAFFDRRKRKMPEPNVVQALRPECAAALPNPLGTAPGLRMALGRCVMFALPGVPSEMQAMFHASVRPELGARGSPHVIRSRILHCVGRGESEIGALLADLMQRGRNPEIGTTAAGGIVGVRINAEGPAAGTLLDAAEAEVRLRLGTLIYGRDGETLVQAVVSILQQRDETLALAESCTGGWLSELVTGVAGASRTYLGGVVAYSNAAKSALLHVPAELIREHGAVSQPVAAALADGARRVFGATWGIGITGIAGPGGGTPEKPVGLVFLGLAGPDTLQADAIHLGGETPRDAIRLRAALAALSLLRNKLLRL